MADIRENRQELQRVIQALGSALVPILPAAWKKVVLGYFIAGENDTPHLQLYTITPFSEDYLDLMEASWDADGLDDAIIEAQQQCQRMRRICAAAHDEWTAMTLCLWADGSFHINYDYDRIEDYNAAFLLKWQSQYLD